MNKGMKTRKLKAFTPAEENCQFAHSVRKFGRAEGAQYNYKAFTLAEILITLVIIGIIAALTIPSVVVKYQKEQTITGLKKVYSTINNALLMSKKDNGNINYGSASYAAVYTQQAIIDIAKKYFEPYLNIQKACYYQDKTSCYNFNDDKSIDGTSNGPFDSSYSYPAIFVLNDGTTIFLSIHNFWIFVDINGNKKPNRMGKDIFCFQIDQAKNSIQGETTNSNNLRSGLISPNNIYSCETSNNGNYGLKGLHCAALIMKDGWKISDDYPW